MFFHRLFSTLFLLTSFFLAVFFSQGNISFIAPLVINLFCITGIYEMCQIGKNKDLKCYNNILMIISSIYIWVLYYFLFNKIDLKCIDSMFILILFFYLLFINVFKKQDIQKEHIIFNISYNLFIYIYITWSIGFILKLLYFTDIDGRALVLFVCIVAKATDIFAYVSGKLFGKNKLIPSISPNKTIEGLIGGIICTIIIMYVIHTFFLSSYFSLLISIILGLCVSFLSIIGDLAESLIKRNANCKDSGAFIPGIGGILDLIDSLIFAAPFYYIALLIIK